MLSQQEIGLYCIVTFLDHTENYSEGLALTRVIGQLTAVEDEFIRIRAWETIPKLDVNSQTEWCIIRSTIKSVERLEKVCNLED